MRFVKTLAHNALNLLHLYTTLLEIALDYPSQGGANREMAHTLTYCQIVSESRHSAKLQAMLIQADNTQPQPKKKAESEFRQL